MLVRDLMTEKVFTIRVDKKVFVAQEIMGWAHIRHVPVVDRVGRVVGMVSHRDILSASVASVSTRIANLERDQHLWTIPVDKVMSKKVWTVSPDAPIQEAARIMRREKIGCLAVVEQDKLVGILTEYDLLRIVEQLSLAA